MRALTWQGTQDVRVETVDDPEIINPKDAILKITSTAICGSDLHIFDGVIPGMMPGDILGHEFMGEVVEKGPASTLEIGQRVIVPFPISCGQCFHCKIEQYSCCENSNPVEKQDMTVPLYGQPMAGIFGYSHLTEDIRAARRNTSGCRSAMSARWRSRTISTTTRCCS